MAGGLFQAQADFGLGIVLAELEEPFPEGFRAGVDDAVLALVRVGINQVQIGFAIGAIQADDQVKRRRILQGNLSMRMFFLSSRRLDRATAI